MVPSISEMTMGVEDFHKYKTETICEVPLFNLNVSLFSPCFKFIRRNCSDVKRNVLKYVCSELAESLAGSGSSSTTSTSFKSTSSISSVSLILEIRIFPSLSIFMISSQSIKRLSSSCCTPNFSSSPMKILRSISSEFSMFLGALGLYPSMSSTMSPLLSILDGMFNFWVTLRALSNTSFSEMLGVGVGDLAGDNGAEPGVEALSFIFSSRSSSTLGSFKSKVPTLRSSPVGSEEAGEPSGDISGDELGEATGEVNTDFDKNWSLDVSNTKNASPPSPSFMGRSVLTSLT